MDDNPKDPRGDVSGSDTNHSPGGQQSFETPPSRRATETYAKDRRTHAGRFSEARTRKRNENPWVQQTYSQLDQLNFVAGWLKASDPRDAKDSPEKHALNILDEGIQHQLQEGQKVLENRRWRTGSAGAVAVSSALARVHAANELLLRRGTDEYVRGQLPEIHSIARKHLAANNPLRIRLEVILQRLAAHDLLLQNSTNDETRTQASSKVQDISETAAIAKAIDAETRETLVAVSAAAHLTYRQEYAQLRSFRNILMVSTVLLFVIAVGLGTWGYLQPNQLSLCFLPEELKKLVCPTAEIGLLENTNDQAGTDIDDAVKLAAQRIDVFLIQFLGLVAAAVSGAASLRRISGSSTPYSLTVALAFIKLPTGALTAVLGLMLMRGGFIPGLTALDSSAQILAWAIIFGAAQQLVTGLVDRQAQGVLANVGGKSHNVIERPATV